MLEEKDLARLAKRFREEAKKTRQDAARDLGVTHTSIFNAEENLKQSLLKLRIRMIEKYSPFKVTGPTFYLEKK
jgi:DNA-binding XRE family transcriptional regulator